MPDVAAVNAVRRVPKPVGETPTGATETVALPFFN